ncbi:MAG TPA: hypothetical protein DD379_19075, partial [Cyanobacteria bacterium UBA11162]|nr:hypothetical protein [Cyanobacteria bacterium UBA11162]
MVRSELAEEFFEDGEESHQEKTLLDRLLEGQSEEFKRKVFELVARTGYTNYSDPLFVILLATGSLQVLLNEKPAELDTMFKRWAAKVVGALELCEGQIVRRQEAAIAEAAASLIRLAHRQKLASFWQKVVPGSVVVAGVLMVGFVAGMTVPPFLQGGYVAGERLTADEAALLHWASSKSGKQARDLYQWNQ